MTDKKLAAGLERGDEAAFQAVVHTYYDDVYKFVYRRVGKRSDAEDITQEVFLKLLVNVRRYRECGKLKSYLFRMAVNAANDFFRKHQRETLWEEMPELSDDSDTPLERILTQERAGFVYRLLRALPEVQATVIILRFYHGMPFAEIAKITDSNVATAKSRYRQGMEKMKKAMEGFEDEG